MGRTPDYMNVTFAGFAGERRAWLGPDGRNEEGVANLAAFQRQLAREDLCLTHTIVHPTVDRARGPGPSPATPCRCTRSARRPSTASSCAVPASWPRWRRSPTRSPSTRAIRCRRRHAAVRAQLLDPDGHARAHLPVPRQRVHAGCRPLRPPAVLPLRRAGRLRHLRRRRGAARPGVHRRRPRRLQLGDGADGVVGRTSCSRPRSGPSPSWSSPTAWRPRMAEAVNDASPRHARDAGRAARLRRGDAQRRAAGRGARLRPRRGRVVPRRPPAAPDAGDPGHLVPAGERHPDHDRQPQPAGHARAGPCSTTAASGR